jgi:hypothetical protein
MLNPGELTGVDVTTDDHEIVGAVARAEDVTAVESNSPARSRNREIFKSLAVGIGLGAATIGAGLIGMNFLDRPRIERQIDQAMRGRGMSREEAELFVSDNAEWTIRDDKKRATQQELDKKRVTEAQEAETKKRAEAEAREKREPDRDLIVYWCFRRAGLGREYATLVSGRHIVTYLDAAFYLWDLGEQESAKAEAAINALRLLLNSGEMLPSSKATIYFAMGKIEETRKNDAKSTEYLNLSRQTAEETFSFLATGTR